MSKLLFVQGIEADHAKPGEQSCIYFKGGVFGGSPEEDERTVFDIREQCVLLGFVEAVDFVHEEQSQLPVEAPALLCFGDGFSKLSDAGVDSGDGLKRATGCMGDEAGEGGFSAAGGAPKDQGGEVTGFDGPPYQFSGAYQVCLSEEFVQVAWAHALCQRGAQVGVLASCLLK